MDIDAICFCNLLSELQSCHRKQKKVDHFWCQKRSLFDQKTTLFDQKTITFRSKMTSKWPPDDQSHFPYKYIVKLVKKTSKMGQKIDQKTSFSMPKRHSNRFLVALTSLEVAFVLLFYKSTGLLFLLSSVVWWRGWDRSIIHRDRDQFCDRKVDTLYK